MTTRAPSPPSAVADAPTTRITGVEVRRYALALDPPFRAAWDPVPRDSVEATVVIVRSEDGVVGYASGDDVPDATLLERLLIGLDPLRTEVVREIFETVDFHGGRPWTVEVAIWDLVGRLVGQPLWRLLGGRSERLLAYVSTAEPVTADERAQRAVALRESGVRAMKLRFHHADWRRDIEVVEEVRDAVGPDVELMVDAHGSLEAATAIKLARELEPYDIAWFEEPVSPDDHAGQAEVRRSTTIPIASPRTIYESSMSSRRRSQASSGRFQAE